MNIQVSVDLVSTFKKHGSSGAKPKKVRSRASSKFNAIVNLVKKGASTEEDGSNASTDVDGANSNSSGSTSAGTGGNPKPYGSHSGNIQVKQLWSVKVTQNSELDKLSNYVANVTSYLETKHGFDLSAAKYQYRSYKDQVTAKYAERYGTKLSQDATSAFLDELAKQAFTYTQHQIRITIVSDIEIAGARKDPDSEVWTLTIKSKMFYTKGKTLMNDEELQVMMGLSKEEVNLRTSKLVRIPAILIYDAQMDRYVVQFKDNNMVVMDSY